jgi:hypothetical protein
MPLQALRSAAEQALSFLALEKYEQLVAWCTSSRLSASDLRRVIGEYGRTVVSPPPTAYDLLDAVQVKVASRPTWAVSMPLWTREEGRSDLTLELTISLQGNEVRVELDDLHIL